MVLPENTNWLYDYNYEDIVTPDVNFSVSGYSWSMQGFNGSTNARYLFSVSNLT